MPYKFKGRSYKGYNGFSDIPPSDVVTLVGGTRVTVPAGSVVNVVGAGGSLRSKLYRLINDVDALFVNPVGVVGASLNTGDPVSVLGNPRIALVEPVEASGDLTAPEVGTSEIDVVTLSSSDTVVISAPSIVVLTTDYAAPVVPVCPEGYAPDPSVPAGAPVRCVSNDEAIGIARDMEQEKKQWLLWIGGGVAAVALIGLGIWWWKNRNK